MNETGQSCCVPARSATGVAATVGEAAPVEQQSLASMRALTGGWFDMGSDDAPHPQDGEAPVRSVWVDDFALAATAVSNRDYARFVEATSYVTVAERLGSSFVFQSMLADPTTWPVSSVAPWWRDVSGACWRAPEGCGSSI